MFTHIHPHFLPRSYVNCGWISLHQVTAESLLIYLQRTFSRVDLNSASLSNCPFIALLIHSLLSVLFLLPSFSPSPSALYLSQHPAANPICSFLSTDSSLPAGHEQRLPEERTGVATHTSLSNQVPVASGRRVSSNDAVTRTLTEAHRTESMTRKLILNSLLQC